MAQIEIPRPQEGEYDPFYAGYIARVTEAEVASFLEQQPPPAVTLLAALSEEAAGYRYAEDKWRVREVVGHMIDTERVFAYRALRIGRGDMTPLAGFEQNDYVRAASFDSRTLADLLDEFQAVRRTTAMLFRSFDAAALNRCGTANANPVTVRALAYIILGHERHHLHVVQTKYRQALL